MVKFKRTHKIWLLRGVFLVAVCAVVVVFFAVSARADTGRYLIDFGDAATPTTAPGWNNITGAQAKDTTTVFPLADSSGAATSLTFRFTDAFTCAPSNVPVNTSGTTASTVYPASATRDTLYLGLAGTGNCTQNDTTAAFMLGGLSQGSQYDIKFYASRTGDNANRTTTYTIGSQSVQLNASNNVNGVATISNVTPVNGFITATVTKPAASSFGYLGVVEVLKKGAANAAPTASAGADTSITLPAHEVTLTGSGADSDGTIASYRWSEASSGGATINTPGNATTTVTDLAAGTYTFRLTVTDNTGLAATDEVQVTVGQEVVTGCSAKKIVVVGSSTAAGTGASPISNAWVNRYTAYVQQLNANNTVVNLAQGGFSTYNVLPTGTTPPSDRPSPDTTRNITAAIAANPQLIIVNLPSNDVANGYSLAEIQNNFQVIKNAAAQVNIPIWFTTTQPRNLDQAGRANQIALRDWLTSSFAPDTLDFWSTVANADGTIATAYSAGDGVHLNNLGHQKLYNRVAGSNLVSSLCAQPPVTVSAVTTTPVVGQRVAWQTNVEASSRVEYGTAPTYGSATSETDTNPRVTAHQVLIPDLTACTMYYYRVISKSATGQEQVSPGATFTTPCVGTGTP